MSKVKFLALCQKYGGDLIIEERFDGSEMGIGCHVTFFLCSLSGDFACAIGDLWGTQKDMGGPWSRGFKRNKERTLAKYKRWLDERKSPEMAKIGPVPGAIYLTKLKTGGTR